MLLDVWADSSGARINGYAVPVDGHGVLQPDCERDDACAAWLVFEKRTNGITLTFQFFLRVICSIPPNTEIVFMIISWEKR